jgi:NADPH:quinone reductase
MKAVVCERWGEPDDVLQVRDVPVPTPGPGQVRVRMLLSPVNPSDVLTVQGRYGKQPPLPATPGFEGVGVVEEGRGLLGWRVRGKRVAVLNSTGRGNWQEQVVIPARQAVPVPSGLSDEQAAMFFVNPATALIMTRYVHRVPEGEWLLQTAGAGQVGRMVIRLGRVDGFRTLNVVRRREQAEELRRLGADAVVATDEESLTESVARLTEGQGVRYALDAVGGPVGSEVIGTLGRGGRVLVYGALSGQPLSCDPRTLLVGQKRVEGFWLSEWVRDQGVLTMLMLFRRLGKLIASGVLASEVGKTFPLDEVKAAVREAGATGRRGKVLLRLGS